MNNQINRDIIMRFLSKEIAIAKQNDDIEKLKVLHGMLEKLQNEYVIDYTIVDDNAITTEQIVPISYSYGDIKAILQNYLNKLTGKQNNVTILMKKNVTSEKIEGIKVQVTTQMETDQNLKYTRTTYLSDEQFKTYLKDALAQREIDVNNIRLFGNDVKVYMTKRSYTR